MHAASSTTEGWSESDVTNSINRLDRCRGECGRRSRMHGLMCMHPRRSSVMRRHPGTQSCHAVRCTTRLPRSCTHAWPLPPGRGGMAIADPTRNSAWLAARYQDARATCDVPDYDRPGKRRPGWVPTHRHCGRARRPAGCRTFERALPQEPASASTLAPCVHSDRAPGGSTRLCHPGTIHGSRPL